MTEIIKNEINDYLYFCKKYGDLLVKGKSNTKQAKKALAQKQLVETSMEIYGSTRKKYDQIN